MSRHNANNKLRHDCYEMICPLVIQIIIFLQKVHSNVRRHRGKSRGTSSVNNITDVPFSKHSASSDVIVAVCFVWRPRGAFQLQFTRQRLLPLYTTQYGRPEIASCCLSTVKRLGNTTLLFVPCIIYTNSLWYRYGFKIGIGCYLYSCSIFIQRLES